MKILSKAERDAALKKAAEEATKRANQSPTSENKKNIVLERIKDSLQKMGYTIKDEDGLKEIIGSDTSLKYDKIGILAQKGIISLNEEELDNSKPQNANIFSISEADIPAPQEQHTPKSEFISKTEKTQKSQPEENKTEALKKDKFPKENPPSKVEKTKSDKQPSPKEDNSETEKKYKQSLEKWCQTTTDKKTGKEKRKIKATQKTIVNSEEETQIEIIPLSPIATKRGDKGAIYKIKKGPRPNQTEVTLGSLEPGKPLNYDYFYALVKAARDSGADTIEFNNIKTLEFRDKLLAAALQFKMKLKNPPGAINLDAPHLQSIPPGCRHYLELHNESVKKTLQKTGKQITPEKGSKFGTGPKAEERSHAEKEFIESEIARLKAQKAEQARVKMEKKSNSPSQEDYDQHPERYIQNQKRRFKPREKAR